MCEKIEWKHIDGFPRYKISSHGDVLSFYHNVYNGGKLLAQTQNKSGYLCVHLIDRAVNRNEHFLVHTLVARYFLSSKPSDKHEIDHKDNNKQNNCYKNLQWLLHTDNVIKSHDNPNRVKPYTYAIKPKGGENAAKLTHKQVQEIKDLKGKMTLKQIAELYNVHFSTISKIHTGNVWKKLQPQIDECSRSST